MSTSGFVLLLLLCCCAAVLADPPKGKIKEAIEYVRLAVPECQGQSNEGSWTARYSKVLHALKVHPEYSKWLQADVEAKKPTSFELPTFDCQLSKSPSTPTSAHKLRPGDVKVVGAIGDSLTAASGARATTVIGLLIEYRGYSWSIGGEVTLNDHTTMPNILRQANDELYGHSTASGPASSSTSRLNVAEPGKVASDMLDQAVRLVSKLRTDNEIDYDNDWKLITLFVGGNDACDYCKDKEEYSPANYIKHIKEALDYLHAHVPRAFVNVAEVLDVSLVKELKDGSNTCSVLLGSLLCKCAAFPENDDEEKEIEEVVAAYQRDLSNLVASGRYDTREDFTVVNQPFYRNSEPPRINGSYDLSLFAPDCFHFSQKGHAEAAKALWNNMLEPVGKKSTQWNPSGGFLCPTTSRPYFATRKNS